MPVRGLIETAFEIAEDDFSGAEFVSHEGEWHRRIGNVNQVHITCEDHPDRHFV